MKTEQEQEFVEIICTGCGRSMYMLPRSARAWLETKPSCCRKRDRIYVIKTTKDK